MATRTETMLVVFIGCNALFIVWLWYRARPGSGERSIMPMLLLLSISMLVGLVPRVLWPAAERLKFGGSIASMILSVLTLIVGARRLFRVGRRAG